MIFKDSPPLFSSPSGQSIKISIRTRTRFASAPRSPSSRSIPFYLSFLPFPFFLLAREIDVEKKEEPIRSSNFPPALIPLNSPLPKRILSRIPRVSNSYDYRPCDEHIELLRDEGGMEESGIGRVEESVYKRYSHRGGPSSTESPFSHPIPILLRRQISNRTNTLLSL